MLVRLRLVAVNVKVACGLGQLALMIDEGGNHEAHRHYWQELRHAEGRSYLHAVHTGGQLDLAS